MLLQVIFASKNCLTSINCDEYTKAEPACTAYNNTKQIGITLKSLLETANTIFCIGPLCKKPDYLH